MGRELGGMAGSGQIHRQQVVGRGAGRPLHHSRSSLGVPVTREGKPRPGFEAKVFYVWFDAPIEYISCAQEWAAATGSDWERWWRKDKGATDVTYIEFMGKDNVAFHAVSFSATPIGSREPWKMVDRLKAFNWVTWYGGKFSTSGRRGIFMDQALDLLPADTWRWKLMANSPESADSAFSLSEFKNGVNSDLGNVFGNFINRILKFTESKFDSVVPDGGSWFEAEDRLASELDTRIIELTRHREAMEFRKAAIEARAIWGLANEYLTAVAPWTVIKKDRNAAAIGVRTGLNLCMLCAAIAYPFIPESSEKVLAAFAASPSDGEGGTSWPSQPARGLLTRLVPGIRIGTVPLLFPRIEDAQVAEWEARFGAPQDLIQSGEADLRTEQNILQTDATLPDS